MFYIIDKAVHMDWTPIITGIISAMAGGGIASWATARAQIKKADNEEFLMLIQEYKELAYSNKAELERLDKITGILQEELRIKDIEIIELRNQLIIFESSHTDIPLPMWLKDTKGTMLFLNDEYEKALLHPNDKTRNQYIGKTDYAVWDKDTADRFMQHDREVMQTKKAAVFTETWTTAGHNVEGTVVKYPRFLNRTVIGVGGIIFETNKEFYNRNRRKKK